MPLYFAYGSNMDDWQMRQRCPHAQFVCVARLEGWQLWFPRFSKKRGGGVASIEENAGATCWGVVYEIPDSEISLLDKSEGFKEGRDSKLNSYNRVELSVREPGTEQERTCLVYVANKEKPYKPSRECYLNYIIRGAEQHQDHGIPDEYIQFLRTIQANE